MNETARNDLRGAAFIVAGGASFATGGAILKHLSADFDWGQLALLRHVFAVVFFLPLIVRGGWRSFATTRPGAHALRGAFGSYSYALFVLALVNMPMGDAFALSYTTPFWSLGLAVLVFGERFGAARIAATALGFVGVAFVVRPGEGGLAGASIFAVVALVSALMTGLAMMMVKRLSATEPPDRIAFWFLMTGIPCLAPIAALDWRPVAWGHVPWFAALGALTFVGQRCLSRGYAIGTFSKMAPLVYVQVAIATAWGFAAFGEVPAWSTLAGMAMIGAGTVWVVRDPARRVTSRRLL
ncbi:MAG: DMT family transporter [Azospirillum sp.]|nr:DMT family transporter [Azospirillum sp.]